MYFIGRLFILPIHLYIIVPLIRLTVTDLTMNFEIGNRFEMPLPYFVDSKLFDTLSNCCILLHIYSPIGASQPLQYSPWSQSSKWKLEVYLHGKGAISNCLVPCTQPASQLVFNFLFILGMGLPCHQAWHDRRRKPDWQYTGCKTENCVDKLINYCSHARQKWNVTSNKNWLIKFENTILVLQ